MEGKPNLFKIGYLKGNTIFETKGKLNFKH